MTITHLLEQWTAVHEKHLGRPMTLRPMSEAELAKFEARFDYEFPEEFRELLRYSNGIYEIGSDGFQEGYCYFPRYDFGPVDEFENTFGGEAADEAFSFEIGGYVSAEQMRDEPNSESLRQSAKLLDVDGWNVVGIVLDRPTKGALWERLGGETQTWAAKSLGSLLEGCLQYEEKGLIEWEVEDGGMGCVGNSGNGLPKPHRDGTYEKLTTAVIVAGNS